MEEILASIRRIIEDSDPTQPPAGVKAVANDDLAARSRSEEARQPAGPEVVVKGGTARKESEMESAAPVQNRKPEVQQPEAVHTPPAPARPAATAEEAAPHAELVSEETSRQVTAAFGELSAAVEETRRRSFEKMAQEMMRPMLKEWLDSNLPSMVERLVKEEIRRITGKK